MRGWPYSTRDESCIADPDRYADSVTVDLPDKHLQGVQATPARLRLEAAIGFYTSSEVTLGQAALLAGISQTQFLHELGKRRICVNYSLEDLESDLKTIEALHPELRPR